MSIVVDASVLVVLVRGDPRREAAQTHLRQWIADDEDIHAPTLLPYEVANGLTRLVAGGLFPSERTSQAWQTFLNLPVTYHPLAAGGDRVVEVALEMRRQSAYDAAYIVLTQQLGADLWTFGPIARNAAALDFPVQLMR